MHDVSRETIPVCDAELNITGVDEKGESEIIFEHGIRQMQVTPMGIIKGECFT